MTWYRFATSVLALCFAQPGVTQATTTANSLAISNDCEFSALCAQTSQSGWPMPSSIPIVTGQRSWTCCDAQLDLEASNSRVSVTSSGTHPSFDPFEIGGSAAATLTTWFPVTAGDEFEITILATSNGWTTATVDIGNDGTIDVVGTDTETTVTIPVPSTGTVPVRIVCNATGSEPVMTATAAVSVRQLGAAGLVTITPYGASCGGASLTAYDEPEPGLHRLQFEVTGAFPNESVFLAIGFVPTITGLPFQPFCFLWTQPAVVGIMQADPTGFARFGLPIATPYQGQFYAQGLPIRFTTAEVLGTQGLSIVIDD